MIYENIIHVPEGIIIKYKFIATDRDGHIYAYTDRPRFDNLTGMWSTFGFWQKFATIKNVRHDVENSLVEIDK